MDNLITAPADQAQDSKLNQGPGSATTSAASHNWRKPTGVIISIMVMAGAVALIFRVWHVIEHHPRTDDAIVRANVIGVAAVAAEEQRLNQAQAALSVLASLIAQRPGAVAAVKFAALELSYCKVIAPFEGRVISLNLSVGAYASAGIPVFSLLDTRKW